MKEQSEENTKKEIIEKKTIRIEQDNKDWL